MIARRLPKIAGRSPRGCRAPRAAISVVIPAAETTPPPTVAELQAIVDQRLIRQFLDGDENAFVEISRLYRAKIFSIVQGMLHDPGDSEEIVQDTFLRAHRSLATFRGDSSLATWLYRIATNLARNRYWYFYRRSRHATVSLQAQTTLANGATFADLISVRAPDPAHDHCQKEFAQILVSCIEKLEARHREILNLRVIQSRSYGEIAKSLGLKAGTVKSRIARARDCLRARFLETCPELVTDAHAFGRFNADRGDGLVATA